MSSHETLSERAEPARARPKLALMLAFVWSSDAAHRAGEVAFLARSGPNTLGRGPAEDGDPGPRLVFGRQRPGRFEPRAPLEEPRLSRVQCVLSRSGAGIHIENRGRAELRVDGEAVESAVLRAGNLLELGSALVLLVVERPVAIEPIDGRMHPFGQPDGYGIVGETAPIWELRRRLQFVAQRSGHVLILGPSGSGKELVAKALHRASPRAKGPFVQRSGATLPESLVDAELFGHAANYPNSGMPERPGLIGASDGGTLFLDEIAEMGEALQSRLLRVLDSGDYQRLGDSGTRHADFRLVGATNRAETELKFDVAARFTFRVNVPGLDVRAEDIPILVHHLLAGIQRSDPSAVARFLGPDGRVAVGQGLMAGLVQHQYSTHVREVLRHLWQALSESPGTAVEAPSTLARADVVEAPQDDALDYEPVDPDSLSAEVVQAALDQCNGVQSQAWRVLRLANRHALARLIRRHGLVLIRRAT